jgi:hypothetical protein
MSQSINRLVTAISSFVALGLTATQVHAASTYVGVGDTAPNGIFFNGGSITQNVSANLLTALNISKTNAQAVEPSVVSQDFGPDPYVGLVRTSLSWTSAVSGVWVDNSSGAITALSSIGGVTLTSSLVDQVSYGGTLSISNLQIDFQTNRVYASLTGDFRGVGTPEGYAPYDSSFVTTLTNVHLWDFQSVQGNLTGGIVPAPLTGPWVSGVPSFSLSNLNITQAGYEHVISALRLHGAGEVALMNVTNYGTITTAVPEPATVPMVLAGLMGIAAMARLRRKL